MKDVIIFLQHILESIKLIEKFTDEISKSDFMDSTQLQDAVIRRFEIIGEAIKNLSKTFTEQHPDIFWSDFAKMRDKLIHKYFGVDLEITWAVLKEDLPKLKQKIKTILEKEFNTKWQKKKQ